MQIVLEIVCQGETKRKFWLREDQDAVIGRTQESDFAIPDDQRASFFHPSEVVIKFQLPVQPSDVKRFAQVLLDAGIFAKDYQVPTKAKSADMLSTEIIVTVDGSEHKQVYPGKAPQILIPVQREMERLVQLVVSSGKVGLLHQGKPVGK